MTFNMANSIEAVDPMVLALRAKAAEVLGDDARFRFEICVTEALVNLVTHAPAPDTDAGITINLTTHSDFVEVEIFDPVGTPPFDPRANAKDLSDVDLMAEGGRGLGLIMQSADAVAYGLSSSKSQHSLLLEFRNARPLTGQVRPKNGAVK